MARDLFHAVVVPHAGAGARSHYTVPLSLIGHGVAATTVVVTTILTRAALPTPAQALAYVNYVPVLPPGPQAPPSTRSTPPPTRNAFVTAAPPALSIDAPISDPVEDTAVDGGVGPCGLPGTPCSGVALSDTLDFTPLATPRSAPAPPAPVRVGGAILPPTKVHHVVPMYPALARASHTQGIVILEATIDVRGAVTDARVLRSVPLLDAAAIDAVRQWRFTPTRLNGEPVPVVMSVTVEFRLQ